MTNPVRDFFFEFSIRDVVKRNDYWAAHIPEHHRESLGGISRGMDGISGSVGSAKDQSNSNSLIENLVYAEVYMSEAMPADMKEKLGSRRRLFDIPAEYDRYPTVYFLNDAAVSMYREA